MLKMAAMAANPKGDTLDRLKPATRAKLTKALDAPDCPARLPPAWMPAFLLLSLACRPAASCGIRKPS